MRAQLFVGFWNFQRGWNEAAAGHSRPARPQQRWQPIPQAEPTRRDHAAGTGGGDASWLGRYAEIRGSGLWNVNHVTGHYEPRFLQRLAQLVDHQE